MEYDFVKMEYYPLASRVLAVAVVGESVVVDGKKTYIDWTAYIDAVPGINHGNEYELVAQHGSKLDYEIAKILFPKHAENLKWRR